MNNLVTLWDPISEKIRNYEILSQCTCWINQHCDSIEILLSVRSEHESVRRDTGYCHHFNHFFIFSLASLSFRYFCCILFKRLFTHFSHHDYGSPHSSTQRYFPCLAIPPGYVRPNNIIYEIRHNSQKIQWVCHWRECVRTRSFVRQHDGYWSIHHMLAIPQNANKNRISSFHVDFPYRLGYVRCE